MLVYMMSVLGLLGGTRVWEEPPPTTELEISLRLEDFWLMLLLLFAVGSQD